MTDEQQQEEQQGFKAPATQQEFDQMVADRLRRERAKFEGFDDYKARAAKFDELDAAQKTEIQRATEQATAAETAKVAAEKVAAERATELLRFQVAASKGITGDDLVLLTGADKDALEKQADRIVALNKGQRVDPGQGRDGHAEAGSAGAAEARRRFGDGSK
jgi:hypothetical protein